MLFNDVVCTIKLQSDDTLDQQLKKSAFFLHCIYVSVFLYQHWSWESMKDNIIALLLSSSRCVLASIYLLTDKI